MSKISPASRLLTQAARDVLRPLGLKQHGSSRIWLDDHDWWLVVMQFQPATSIQGSYLKGLVHAAVAAGLFGDVRRSRARFEKVPDDPDGKGTSPFSWATELQERVRRPYDMVGDSDAFRAWARDQVLSCRGQLNLGSPTRAPFEPAEPLDRM